MRRLILAAALAAAALPSLAFTPPAHAQGTNTPVIDRREQRQENRIGAGTADGSLTSREAARLNRGQARVDRMENRAEADGRVTGWERARIQHQQNVQNRRIYRQRHDGQTGN
jgi:hypothetical protein